MDVSLVRGTDMERDDSQEEFKLKLGVTGTRWQIQHGWRSTSEMPIGHYCKLASNSGINREFRPSFCM